MSREGAFRLLVRFSSIEFLKFFHWAAIFVDNKANRYQSPLLLQTLNIYIYIYIYIFTVKTEM